MAEPILNRSADAVAGSVKLAPELDAAVARLQLSSGRNWFAGTDGLDCNRPARMVGANMAFHRRVLDRVPGFDVELGPGALGFFDETLFSFQLLAAGYRLVGMFDNPVEHHFDLSRLTRESLMDSARKMGRSHAFIFHHWEHQKSRLVIPRLILCHLRHHWARPFEPGDESSRRRHFNRLLELEQELAFYREYLVQRQRPFKYTLRGLVPQAVQVKTGSLRQPTAGTQGTLPAAKNGSA